MHYSWQRLPTDPASAGIVAQIMSERRRIYKEAPIWVVGEVEALKLLNVHRVSIAEIEKGIATWGYEPAGEFYSLLAEICQPGIDNRQRFQKLVDGFDVIDKKEVTRQLSKVGMPSTGYTDEVSVPQAIRDGYVSIGSREDINENAACLSKELDIDTKT